MEHSKILSLSLWQPWASLLALGAGVKPHETRSWATPYRGRVLIHAAKDWRSANRNEAAKADALLRRHGVEPPDYPLGCFVGYGTVAACEAVDDPRVLLPSFTGAVPDHPLDRAFGDWEPGRFAWRFSGVTRFDPVAARGYQGLWEPTPGQVRECLTRAAVSAVSEVSSV